MKKILFFLAFFLVGSLSAGLSAQETEYYDASVFPLYGKAAEQTKTRYERLPAALEGNVREPVWRLGRDAAGLYIRFRTNSTVIRARWTSLYDTRMNHMTDTGSKGLDLYAWIDGQWRFVGCARPQGKENDAVMISNMEPEYREYMMYLSLYDGVESLKIGIDKDAVITPPLIDTRKSYRPIVAYGTSILQGGCVSRPGMAHTSVLGRRAGLDVINLGFSGNALLDLEIAHLMAAVPHPALFILDYVPNAWADMIDKDGETFFRIIRDAHPDVPVIFIEDPTFPHSVLDTRIAEEIRVKNEAQKLLYLKLKAAKERNIYYIGTEGMIGDDGEATVDGIHFTDLGVQRYVDHIWPTVKKALRKSGLK